MKRLLGLGMVSDTVRTLELISSGAMATALGTSSRRSCWAAGARFVPAL